MQDHYHVIVQFNIRVIIIIIIIIIITIIIIIIIIIKTNLYKMRKSLITYCSGLKDYFKIEDTMPEWVQ